ncbi:MAG: spore coat associated protein CotJA [Ruminococcaceae bacterium]|nr:spore coat associated protein CotJA [Oscillospiraceae bacterium]
MYRENNDIRTPRDRVSENDLARYLLIGERERVELDESRDGCGCEGQQNGRSGQSGRNDRNDRNCRGENRRGCACENVRQNVRQEAREACALCGDRRPREDGRDCSAYTVPLGYPLAAVYVPRQAWRSLYECSEALSHGTLFVELDKPLEVAQGRKCR